MRQINLFAILIATMVTIFSCQKVDEPIDNVVQTLTAYAPGCGDEDETLDTKVGFTEAESGNIELDWQVNDVITIYDATSSDKVGNWRVTSVASDGKADFAKVDGENLMEGVDYTAVYPASTATTLSDRDSETITTATQIADDNMDHLDDNLRMSSASFQMGSTMSFDHEVVIMSVRFESSDVPTVAKISSQGETYTTNLSGLSAGVSTAHFILPPSSGDRDVEFIVNDKEENKVIKSTSFPFEAGKYYTWNTASCTVTFDANGGVGTMAQQIFASGTSSALTASTLTKTDYVFMGWATEATATEVLYGEEEVISPTESLTLYAVWYDLADVVYIESDGNITKYKEPYNELTKFTVPSSYKGTPITSVVINPSISWYVGTLMKKIVISEGITTIGQNCFLGHRVLNDVTLPSTLKTIENCAFSSCYDLMSITLPESVESIGDQAFENTNLSEITLPANLNYLAGDALPKTIDNIYVAEGNTTYSSVDGNLYSADGKTFVRVAPNKESFTFGAGVETIGYNAFKDSKITQITIPETVTSIEGRAFEDCSYLKSITIPSQVTRIESFLFIDCYALESVTFMGDITSIGWNAFRDNKSLKSITLPSTLTHIGDFTFMGSGLTSIVIPSLVSSVGEKVFDGCRDLTAINVEGKSERPEGWDVNWDVKDGDTRHTVNWNYVAE